MVDPNAMQPAGDSHYWDVIKMPSPHQFHCSSVNAMLQKCYTCVTNLGVGVVQSTGTLCGG